MDTLLIFWLGRQLPGNQSLWVPGEVWLQSWNLKELTEGHHQEWISGKKIVPTKPTYSLAIKARHAARVKATKDRIDLRLRGLTTEKAAIEAELIAGSSTDRTLLKELREVEDQMAKAEIELIDEVDMKLTEDEKIK